MQILLQIFISFFRVGALTFGGGYAMMPILQREVVEKRKWATEAEIMDYYALSQCLPGIIMVNTSVFVGRKRKGAAGGIAAALGSVAPSLIIITLIAAGLTAFSDVPAIKNAFAGIRVCVCVLIFNAVLQLWKKAVIDIPTLIIFAVVLLLSAILDLSPILLVVAAAVAGIIIKGLEAKAK